MLKHSKKIVLVDPHKRMTDVDRDIRRTLGQNIPDDIKAKEYYKILTQHMRKKKQPRQEKDTVEDEVLQLVPQQNRYKAKRILRLIKESPEAGWNERGEFIYRQRTIPGSNVIDLVVDTFNKNSQDPPEGWQLYASAIKDAPKELVLNPLMWKYIHPPAKQRKRIKEKTLEDHNWLDGSFIL